MPISTLTPTGLTAYHLCAAGLVIGAATALAGPAERAVLSDISDQLGPAISVRTLAWQDFAHRITMFLGPPLGGLGVATIGAVPLLWAEASAVLISAGLLATIHHRPAPAPSGAQDSTKQGIRDVLARHRDVRTGIILAGIGGLVWFAFSLGLTILGAEEDKPGQLIAAGLTGYGIGSTAATVAASKILPRLPLLETICTAWILLGTTFALLAAVTPSLIGIGVIAGLGGIAMPIGIGALNALISTRTTGDERRTAFAAETIIHDGATAVGLAAGGAIIGLIGVPFAFILTGAIPVVAGGVVLSHRLLERAAKRNTHNDDVTPPPPDRAERSG